MKLPLSLFLLLLFCIPLTLAADYTFIPTKEHYTPGETAQFALVFAPDITLTYPLQSDQFQFTTPSGEKIGVVKTLTRLNPSEYYQTFEIPAGLDAGTYLLTYKNVYYSKNNKQELRTISANITLQPSNTSILLRPAFFYQQIDPSDQPSFTFTIVQSREPTLTLRSDSSSYTPVPSTIDFTHSSQATVTIYTHVAEHTDSSLHGSIILEGKQSYTVPIYLQRKGIPALFFTASNTSTASPTNQTPAVPSLTPPSTDAIQLTALQSIDQTLQFNDQLNGRVSFRNTASQSLTHITLILSPSLQDLITLEQTTVPLLGAQEETSVRIFLKNARNRTQNVQGELLIQSAEGTQTRLPIHLSLQHPPVLSSLPSQTHNQTEPPNRTISTPEPPSNTSALAAALFLLLLFIVCIFILYKLRKKKQKEDPFQKIIEEAYKH